MAVHTITKWPAEILAQVASPVGEVDDEILALATDLRDTMYTAFGIGLAAPQVGVAKAVCVIEYVVCESQIPPDPLMPSIVALINPVWKSISKNTFVWEEACLSVEGITARVVRHNDIELEYTDLTGQRNCVVLHGKTAGVVQHETDHLIGKVFIDRLPKKKASDIRNRFLRNMRSTRLAAIKEQRKEKIQILREQRGNEESTPTGRISKPGKKKQKKPKTFGKNKRRKK